VQSNSDRLRDLRDWPSSSDLSDVGDITPADTTRSLDTALGATLDTASDTRGLVLASIFSFNATSGLMVGRARTTG
jgi:hypothetical protein